MGRAKVYTACRDCKRCTNSPIADSSRSFGRKALAVYTLGSSELVFAANKKCRLCGHQMSLHRGTEATTVQPVVQIQVQSPDPKPIRNPTKLPVHLTDDGWPWMAPLPKKEAALLASTLTTNEPILGQLVGRFHQISVATTNRLIIIKSGMMADSVFGNKTTSFSYQNITSVEVHATLTQGYFEISAAGMVVPNTNRMDKSTPRHHLPNVVPFYKSERERWDLFASKVRLMASGEKSEPMKVANRNPGDSSIPEMIAQLAKLHDAGILTDAEFAEKKADLLSRM